MPVAKRTIDFSNVKESSGINPKHVEAGDYAAKIIDVREQIGSKKNADSKDVSWVFVFQLVDMKSATYAYYCNVSAENQLWKVRNLLVAAGKTVPAKRVGVDPNKLVGSVVGISLEDDEYEGKMKSTIDAVFPASELEDSVAPDDDDEAGDEDADEAPEASDDEGDDEDDEADLDLEDV